jgi:N-acetylglucosamine kinase-like BadF-type ATPase
MSGPFRIGVDGGGTKTECILVDDTGAIVARHLAPGCNPSIVGPEKARQIIADALTAIQNQPALRDPQSAVSISHTHIYAAGNRAFWRDTAATLEGFGAVFTADDSYPVLELATDGKPGLVLHGGTGSFVAARGPDGRVHYAGGVGWRFGDAGSGYDLGRRAIARGLLELQGWAPVSPLLAAVRDHTGLGSSADAAAVTRFFYYHADPNRQVAALAPTLLQLAGNGDSTAHRILVDSITELLALAKSVATQLFSMMDLATLPAGISGPILTHPVVAKALASQSPFRFAVVEAPPIEGVRRLLMNDRERGQAAVC